MVPPYGDEHLICCVQSPEALMHESSNTTLSSTLPPMNSTNCEEQPCRKPAGRTDPTIFRLQPLAARFATGIHPVRQSGRSHRQRTTP